MAPAPTDEEAPEDPFEIAADPLVLPPVSFELPAESLTLLELPATSLLEAVLEDPLVLALVVVELLLVDAVDDDTSEEAAADETLGTLMMAK